MSILSALTEESTVPTSRGIALVTVNAVLENPVHTGQPRLLFVADTAMWHNRPPSPADLRDSTIDKALLSTLQRGTLAANIPCNAVRGVRDEVVEYILCPSNFRCVVYTLRDSAGTLDVRNIKNGGEGDYKRCFDMLGAFYTTMRADVLPTCQDDHVPPHVAGEWDVERVLSASPLKPVLDEAGASTMFCNSLECRMGDDQYYEVHAVNSRLSARGRYAK